jgi:hypothetical protein
LPAAFLAANATPNARTTLAIGGASPVAATAPALYIALAATTPNKIAGVETSGVIASARAATMPPTAMGQSAASAKLAPRCSTGGTRASEDMHPPFPVQPPSCRGAAHGMSTVRRAVVEISQRPVTGS